MNIGISEEHLEYLFHIAPVDFASQSIIKLSMDDTSYGKAIPLVHGQNLRIKDIIPKVCAKLGIKLNILTSAAWKEAKEAYFKQASDTDENKKFQLETEILLRKKFNGRSILSLLADDEPPPHGLSDWLAERSIVCPSMDDHQLWDKYFEHLCNLRLYTR